MTKKSIKVLRDDVVKAALHKRKCERISWRKYYYEPLWKAEQRLQKVCDKLAKRMKP